MYIYRWGLGVTERWGWNAIRAARGCRDAVLSAPSHHRFTKTVPGRGVSKISPPIVARRGSASGAIRRRTVAERTASRRRRRARLQLRRGRRAVRGPERRIYG